MTGLYGDVPFGVADPDHPARAWIEGEGASWADLDLGSVLTEIAAGTYQPPKPTIASTGDRALFYVGKVNEIHGMPGCGKTWVSAIAIAECLSRGQHVVFIDLEDTPATLIERLMIHLSVSGDAIRRLLHYKRPSEPAKVGQIELHRTVVEFGCVLVVLDSTGEGMAAEGIRQNEDAEVAEWMRAVARSTADLGPAVVLIDHVPKADETALMPIGSQRKQAAIDGAVYSVQIRQPFSRDRAGWSRVVCGKDRAGAAHRGEVVAELHVTPDGDRSTVVLTGPSHAPRNADGTFRPTTLMQRVSEFLEHAGAGTSKNGIEAGVQGNRDAIRVALEVLVTEGFADVVMRGQTLLHYSVKPYRRAEDPLDDDVRRGQP